MRKENFKEWLSNKMQKKPISDCVSRCKTVEATFQIDLDTEYFLDNGEQLLSKMQYTIADERNQKEAPTGFHFKSRATIRYRMANLRSAVSKYFAFCEETNN